MANPATERQLDAIAAAARAAGFTNPQDACDAADISSRNWRYDLNRADASQLIDRLRAGLAPAPEPEPTASLPAVLADGEGLAAADAVTMLGRKVTVTFSGSDGSDVAREGRVQSIELSPKGKPAVKMITIRTGATIHIALARVTSWTIHD